MHKQRYSGGTAAVQQKYDWWDLGRVPWALNRLFIRCATKTVVVVVVVVVVEYYYYYYYYYYYLGGGTTHTIKKQF